MSYLAKNYLLENKTAEELYFGYAEKMPIFDYHCHLSERQILENKPFADVYEIWLAGDHYKWRLMRNHGVPEALITGDNSHKEKFRAYCETLATAFGNPLYHWSQVELSEFFGCDLEINAENADAIWDICNEYIRTHDVTPQSLIERSNVTHVFTTNEVYDDLSVFEEIAKKDYRFRVIPAFRTDKMLHIDADAYNSYIDRLGDVKTLDEFERALEERLLAFMKVGTTASDVSLLQVLPVASKTDAETVFAKRRRGDVLTTDEVTIFKGYFLYFLLKLYAKYGIVAEIHLGPMRNNSERAFSTLGPDTGFDSIAEEDGIANLSALFSRLEAEGSLPRTVVFNLNPKMNLEILSLLGCFQSDEVPGKMQYGPAWWFLDNKAGMEKHLSDLCSVGDVSTFIGMLTDSRSLLSYPRHHYFRRILCNYFGTMMEKGEMTANRDLVGKTVQNICYGNAIRYFKMN